MKKITFLLSFLISLSMVANTQNLVNDFHLNENFQTVVAPWAFTPGANTTITIVDAGAPRNNVFNLAVASASGRRISNRVFSPAYVTDPASHNGRLNVSFEWQSGTPTGGNRGFIRLMDGTNIILAVGTEGGTTTNVLHYGNLVPGSHNALVTTTLITPTAEGVNFPRNEWYRVDAEIDFATKMVTNLTITRLSNNTTWSIPNTAFIGSAANALSRIEIEGGRQGTSNGAWTTQIDNFQVFSVKQSAGQADVTIHYLDQNNEPAKPARVVAQQPIGVPFVALASDKESFAVSPFYYAYNAVATISDQVLVAAGGSEITLRFKKSPLTPGTYTWTGIANANWNEIDENFTTDHVNALGYQNDNPILFPATGLNKAVQLTNALQLGAQNVTVAGDGYSIAGGGALHGTGSLILNLSTGESTSLNIINHLTGGVVINGGTGVVLRDAASTRFTMATASALNLATGVAFNKPIAGEGTITLIPVSNVTYSAPITGITQLNYNLVSAGTVNASGAFSSMPILNNTVPTGTLIQVENTLTTPAMFGSTLSFANAKVALGTNVEMVFPQNPASDGSTSISLGELSGVAGSVLRSPRIGRTVAYHVGGLNTNATFAGVLQNFDVDAWGFVGTLNFTKTGTGKLTLAGNSTGFTQGSVTVAGGELEVTGVLSAPAVPLTVAEGATLSGNGTISGAATVNGILNGRLSFSNNLVLAPSSTTNLQVSGFGANEFDQINVLGNLTKGGTVNVVVSAAPPAIGTQITLINATNSTGTFAGINVPVGYSFDEANGMLTYDFGSSVNQVAGFRVYPTLVTNEVFVDGQGITNIAIFNIAGQLVKSISAIGERNTIHMSHLANGAYLMKVGFADGSVKVQNILLQK